MQAGQLGTWTLMMPNILRRSLWTIMVNMPVDAWRLRVAEACLVLSDHEACDPDTG